MKLKVGKRIERSLYRKIHSLMPIPCVDLVIERSDYVLVGKRTTNPLKGMWFLPGGRLMRNERVWEAGRRIAWEETGLKVSVVEILGWDETFFHSDPFGHRRGTHTINVILRAYSGRGAIRADGQHSELKWIPRDKIETLIPLHPRVENIINCGRKYEIDGVEDPFEMVCA